MTEPSRQTAARRRREQLALSRRLDEEFGPDGSAVAHTFADEWTVRRVVALEDQRREGLLMGNCLQHLRRTPDSNCWSLRDRDNLPHVTFTVWSVGQHDDLREIPEALVGGLMLFIKARRALLMVDGRTRPLKEAHRRRLRAFGATSAAGLAPAFPRDTAGRIRVAADAIDPGFRVHTRHRPRSRDALVDKTGVSERDV